MIKINPETDALFVIDATPTFMPGGGLPVPEGDLIVPVILNVAQMFYPRMSFATVDKHIYGHISLASSYVGFPPFYELTYEEVVDWSIENDKIAAHAKFNIWKLLNYLAVARKQVLWPDHGLAGSSESDLHPELAKINFSRIWVKGMDPACDSNGAFFDNMGRPTGFGSAIQKYNIRRGFYTGLAEDVCVGISALGGIDYGIQPYVISDATRPVANESRQKMHEQFAEHGVQQIHSSELSIS